MGNIFFHKIDIVVMSNRDLVSTVLYHAGISKANVYDYMFVKINVLMLRQ